MMDWDGDWSGHSMTWGAWFGMALLLLVVGLLVVAVVEVITRSTGPVPPPGNQPPGHETIGTADRILDERFARGEIDEQEYRARRAALRSS